MENNNKQELTLNEYQRRAMETCAETAQKPCD